MSNNYKGLAVSPGTGIAVAFCLEGLDFVSSGQTIQSDPAGHEIARLETACADVARALEETRPDAAFQSLMRMLSEPLFRGSIIDRIKSGRTAMDAVIETVNDLKAIFGESPDPLLRERADHAEEVGRLVLRSLHGWPLPIFEPENPVIIITEEMSAFDAARLNPRIVSGVICSRGGLTSHFAIIAKQIGIPVVSGIPRVMDCFRHGELCICDGSRGIAIASPDTETLDAARSCRAVEDSQAAQLGRLSRVRPTTLDGTPVNLWANIAGPGDVQAVLDAGGAGVGMFRTEFIFMGDEPPSQERQALIYADILSRTPGPVVMRTLEAGGDKIIPYLAGEPEENPNLGWQGLRMCLDTPDIFLTQLKAMIRASGEGDLWIMFPFVSARWELDLCRKMVARADDAVRRSGVMPGPYKVGVMVEIPSAVIMAGEYLRGFDFCAVGTNDLTQFTLAADRMNPKVSRWYDPFHPAVLRLIAMTARAARNIPMPIGMCGDMAGNPLSIPFLLGLGFTYLSVAAPSIPEVKKTILPVDMAKSRNLAGKVLELEDSESILSCLQDWSRSQA